MSNNRRRLIINVDDFGPSEQVSFRAIEAYRNNFISSVSAIINIDWSPEITALALDLSIPMGIHLNYTSGKSTLLRDNSLVDKNHAFLAENLKATSHIVAKELYDEFENQILRVKDLGIEVTHIDNHKEQIYFSPDLFDVVFRLASKYSLPLRNPFRGLINDDIVDISNRYKIPREYIQKSSEEVSKLGACYQVKSPHKFINDIWESSAYPSYLKRQLETAPDLTELCLHVEGDLGQFKLDYITSKEFGDYLHHNNWVIVGYDQCI